MERYVLNETALCGFVTSYGAGAAAQALSSQAVPTLMIHARPAASSMNMPTSGAGLLARLGRGLSSMAAIAQARGYLLICGIGDAALMALTALADGRLIPVARGTSIMALQAVASGVLASLGQGLARLSLDGAGRLTQATHGQGEADQVMAGSLGIPHPISTPDKFTSTHAARRVMVVPDDPGVLVAPIERTHAVPHEARMIIVAPERNP